MGRNIVKIKRSTSPGKRPVTRLIEAYELSYNVPDHNLMIQDATGQAIDLVGIRKFSTTGKYKTGDMVIHNGSIYKCGMTTGPGFTPMAWQDILVHPGQIVNQTGNSKSARIPKGTTLQRDSSPGAGYFRFNTEHKQAEIYNGADWQSVGGGLRWKDSGWNGSGTGKVTVKAGEGITLSIGAGPNSMAEVTLPATPEPGDLVGVVDLNFADTSAANRMTIIGGSENIMGMHQPLNVDIPGASVILLYANAVRGWVIVGGAW